MLASIHTIAETRVKREHHARNSLSVMFWFAAISGVIFTGLAFYPYMPRRSNLSLLALLGAFTGIILFFIYAFSNPFKDPGRWQPMATVTSLPAVQSGGGPIHPPSNGGREVLAARLLHGALQVGAGHHAPGMRPSCSSFSPRQKASSPSACAVDP